MGDVQELLVEVTPFTTIISGLDSSNITTRSGHFLLPRAGQANPPKPSSAPKIPSPIPANDLQVRFDKCWAGSPEQWRKWMAKLRPMHEPVWREIGILDGLVTSTCRFKRDETVLVELAMFWSSETNTFIFPWGEATVTLEDMAMLGGLPQLGGFARDKPSPEIQEDVKALERHRTLLNQTKYRKPTYSAWVNHFLESEDGTAERVEHAAFLAMWLSKFVLKKPPFDVVRPEVFNIAARMAHGQGVALAPAALAGLYRGLSTLKRDSSSSRKEETFVVGVPFNVMQLWVWERFPALRPEIVSSQLDGHNFPRAARWDSVQTRLDRSTVRKELKSPTQFEWMPYRGRNLALMPQRGWVSGDDIIQSKTMQSFARCIHACDLLGMHCTEMYHPYRVARQLGFDQDVPGTVTHIRSGCKEAWTRYDLKPESITFFVPDSEPGTTVKYMKWWKKYYSSTIVSKKRGTIVIKEGTSTSTDPCMKRQRQIKQLNAGKDKK